MTWTAIGLGAFLILMLILGPLVVLAFIAQDLIRWFDGSSRDD